ncbi:peptidylprolyl isomerase [Gemmatimonadota bacterium]
MYRLIISLMALVISSCSIADAIGRKVVARAGAHVLTVDWFAETLGGSNASLRPDLVERWAWSWVDYSLFLQAMADGETFADSATVAQAMWPEVLFTRVDVFEEELAEAQLQIDSATVDSAYAAGEYRIIDHILFGANASDSQSARSEIRRRAEVSRARLVAGGSWAIEARASDDRATRSTGGRIGMIERGQTVPEFEQVVFSMEPGDLSEVTETQYGYHILRRPTLAEVHEEYERRISEILLVQWREALAEELTERRGVRVTDDGLAIMRDAVERPVRVLVREPGRVIGTYDGGSLTDVGFVRWLQALSDERQISVVDTSDAGLRQMAMVAMQSEVLDLVAREAGVEISQELYGRIKLALEGRLRLLRRVLGVDSAMARAEGPAARQQVAHEALLEYKTRTARNLREVVKVPPFLAAKLRSERPWSFSYSGLNKAIRRATELRAMRDSTSG